MTSLSKPVIPISTPKNIPQVGNFKVEDVYLHSPHSRRGTRMHYQAMGDENAPPLVLLHGIGGSTGWWSRNWHAFTPYYRVYALDLPGFGRSWRLAEPVTIDRLARYVVNWLDCLNLPRITLLGHSMGGQIAARIAASYPERIEKLILAAPAGLWLKPLSHLQWVFKVPKVHIPLNQALTIASGTIRTDLIALLGSLRAVARDNTSTACLAKIIAPTLVMWGTADFVLPPALAELVAAGITGAPVRIEYIENGTHDFMFDQAASFNRVVIDFLQSR